MSSLLRQLENNEAVLLMYLADELPAEDRAEVEQMLATDSTLRAALDELRAADDAMTGALRAADAADAGLVAPVAPAVRRVAREMHQWQVRRLAPPPPPEPAPELRFPWWSYPLATAAAVLLAFVVWWGTQDTSPSPGPQVRGDDGVNEFYGMDRFERRRQWLQLLWEYGGGSNPEGVDALLEVELLIPEVNRPDEEPAVVRVFLWDERDEDEAF